MKTIWLQELQDLQDEKCSLYFKHGDKVDKNQIVAIIDKQLSLIQKLTHVPALSKVA